MGETMRIEDYGLISDMHTAALVGVNGSIDWLCLPRFDSPACFAALLGTEDNGFWRIAPADTARKSSQQYRDSTMVLETVFETESGVVRVVDCMALRDPDRSIVRLVEGVSGEVPMRMQLAIRFDYGKAIPWVQAEDGGVLAVAGPDALVLRTEVPTRGENFTTVADFSVKKGESKSFVLTWYPSHQPMPEPADPRRLLSHAEAYWREWVGRCTYDGPWKDHVVRSLLAFKAMTFAPTGGIVAAVTTSLPEHVGGMRNWDYRYCWLRDTAFTLSSMMLAGYTEEAAKWIEWLLRAVAGDAAQLQTMYGPAGERRLTEVELSHLSGYENSKPVRIGNAACEQFQLDVYGEVMSALHQARVLKIPAGDAAWRLQRHLVEFVENHWEEPDEGIWEIRGPRRHFTHSKVMAWVAIDRAVKAVEEFQLEGDADRWKKLRDQMHETICREGYNAKRGAFTQFFGSDLIDASALLIPLVRFLPANDERVVRTIEAIQRDLTVDGFVIRYKTGDSSAIDGLPAGEGVFLPCSFWLAACLSTLGRHQEAKAILERLIKLSSPLGLYSEEYEPRQKRLLGNYPQAFTHVALIRAVQRIAAAEKGLDPAEHSAFDPMQGHLASKEARG